MLFFVVSLALGYFVMTEIIKYLFEKHFHKENTKHSSLYIQHNKQFVHERV